MVEPYARSEAEKQDIYLHCEKRNKNILLKMYLRNYFKWQSVPTIGNYGTEHKQEPKALLK